MDVKAAPPVPDSVGPSALGCLSGALIALAVVAGWLAAMGWAVMTLVDGDDGSPDSFEAGALLGESDGAGGASGEDAELPLGSVGSRLQETLDAAHEKIARAADDARREASRAIGVQPLPEEDTAEDSPGEADADANAGEERPLPAIPTDAEVTWEGKAPLRCAGSKVLVVRGTDTKLRGGPAVQAKGKCTLFLVDVRITAERAISAIGSATVNVIGGEVQGTNVAIQVAGQGQVNVYGADVRGKVQRGGEGKVSGL